MFFSGQCLASIPGTQKCPSPALEPVSTAPRNQYTYLWPLNLPTLFSFSSYSDIPTEVLCKPSPASCDPLCQCCASPALHGQQKQYLCQKIHDFKLLCKEMAAGVTSLLVLQQQRWLKEPSCGGLSGSCPQLLLLSPGKVLKVFKRI